MSERVADKIAARMREIGITRCCWGDGFLSENFSSRSLKTDHPLDRITSNCNSMERAPDLFEKYFIRGHDCGGRPRNVRAFLLKDQTQ